MNRAVDDLLMDEMVRRIGTDDNEITVSRSLRDDIWLDTSDLKPQIRECAGGDSVDPFVFWNMDFQHVNTYLL